MRDSIKINLYFAFLSFLFVLICFRIFTAVLIKKYKSSGISGAKFFCFKTRNIRFPVTWKTWGIPCWSLRRTPIWDGVIPFLLYWQMVSTNSSLVCLIHTGAVRTYGNDERALPFLCKVTKNALSARIRCCAFLWCVMDKVSKPKS